jgi:tight adherence protein B
VNNAFVIIAFLVLFAIVLMSVSLAYRFLEAQRKRQMQSMLEVTTGRSPSETETSILVEDEAKDVIVELWGHTAAVRKLKRLIQQAGLNWTVSRLVALTIILGIAGMSFGLFLQPLGFVSLSAIGGAALLGSAPTIYTRFKRTRRTRDFEEQLPEALDFLARSMRAGHAFSISLEMLGSESPDPLGYEFRALSNELNLGASLDVALANFATRVPLLDVRLFVSSVLLQKQTGGNLSEILGRLAYVIRERFRLRGQVRAASAHGRLTALVLTCIPIVLVIALTLVAPDYLPLLAADPDGKYIILGAVVGQVLGYLTMRRITNIKV